MTFLVGKGEGDYLLNVYATLVNQFATDVVLFLLFTVLAADYSCSRLKDMSNPQVKFIVIQENFKFDLPLTKVSLYKTIAYLHNHSL